jgi:hypothetical protein
MQRPHLREHRHTISNAHIICSACQLLHRELRTIFAKGNAEQGNPMMYLADRNRGYAP